MMNGLTGTEPAIKDNLMTELAATRARWAAALLEVNVYWLMTS